jgi:hypothetical protein
MRSRQLEVLPLLHGSIAYGGRAVVFARPRASGELLRLVIGGESALSYRIVSLRIAPRALVSPAASTELLACECSALLAAGSGLPLSGFLCDTAFLVTLTIVACRPSAPWVAWRYPSTWLSWLRFWGSPRVWRAKVRRVAPPFVGHLVCEVRS